MATPNTQQADQSCIFLFPWLETTHPPQPCDCQRLGDAYTSKTTNLIIHLFNEHVMQGGKISPYAEPWTLEKLADWIDSVDPTPRAETAPEVEELVAA